MDDYNNGVATGVDEFGRSGDYLKMEIGEGTYYLKNAGQGNYLRWDSKYDDWTTSADDKTAVAFRVVDGLPEEPDDGNGLEVRATPVSGATLQEGDTIELSAAQGAAIYYTTDGTDPTRDSAV